MRKSIESEYKEIGYEMMLVRKKIYERNGKKYYKVNGKFKPFTTKKEAHNKKKNKYSSLSIDELKELHTQTIDDFEVKDFKANKNVKKVEYKGYVVILKKIGVYSITLKDDSIILVYKNLEQ